MRAITEAILRAELKAEHPDIYYIPEGKILSPAAREYLNQLQIGIDFERNREKREAQKAKETKKTEEAVQETESAEIVKPSEPKKKQPVMRFIDEETGGLYADKPEHMTHLFGNRLVDKNHPRIVYRGKLDKLQADLVLTQAVIAKNENSRVLLDDLDDILRILRELMRCEVLDEPFTNETIIGLNHKELREHSHNPQKFYNIEYMLLPEYSMGETYALLNMIRAEIREVELVAVDAFKVGRKMTRSDIIEELNRLSSALHIMMCKYLGGAYKEK